MGSVQNRISPEVVAELHEKLAEDGIQKTVVGAVIHQNGKYLLVERAAEDFMGGLIELPSGTVDAGEDIFSALVREVKEETNLDIQSIDTYAGAFDYTSGSGKNARQLNFCVTVKAGSIQLNPAEHTQYFLLAPGAPEFTQLNISKKSQAIIEQNHTLPKP